MRTFLTVVLLGLVAAVTSGVFAQSTQPQHVASVLDDIANRGILRVGMPGDYLPFASYDSKDQSWKGLDVDEADAMAKALGVKLEIVKTSWPNLTADLLSGKFDMAAGGVSVSLDRQESAFFSSPIISDGKTAITRCENVDKFSSLDGIDQPGVRVITPQGGTNEVFDRTHFHKASIVVEENTKIFDELVAGGADVMVTDATETRLQEKLHPKLCAVHPDRPFSIGEKAFLLPRDVALKAWVDQFLHIQAEAGEKQTMISHWLH